MNRHCHIGDVNKVDLSKVIKLTLPPIVSEDKWNIAQSRLVNNKNFKPTQDELFTLQGLIKCGSCGYPYRTERLTGHRYYVCRGKLKTAHLDGSPRCTNKFIRADCLEQAVWTRVMDIVNDPNKLKPMLVVTINNLKDRESSLESRLLPIEKRSKEIAERKSHLVDKFVINNMDPEKYKANQQNLEKEEARLIALRKDVDPNQLVELESTRGLLKLWQKQVNSMAWNLEDGSVEDKSVMVRTMDETHNTVLKLLGIGDGALSGIVQFPTTQRELFDKLQLRLVVFKDKIEVKAVSPMPDIKNQECTFTRD